MENLISLGERLLNGEKVVCEDCEKGYYLPLNPNAKTNHYYYCSECGKKIHFEENVVVE